MSNREELYSQIQYAKAARCFIEVLSLRLQYLDVWLRVFFENTPHHGRRKREFGWLLEQCLNQGLDKKLYDRIARFNEDRVKAIRGYLIGLTTYAEIEKNSARFRGPVGISRRVCAAPFRRNCHSRGFRG
jgi:hypothetical protein